MNGLVKTETVAELLGLAPITLRLWRSVGKGPPFVKCGSAVRYRAEDLKEWVNAQTIHPEKTTTELR